jgi:biopolymer transport protein ExbD
MQFVEPRPARPLAIRITPLIDVVFILLVFFMLTTRLLPVNLMEVSTQAQSESGGQAGDPIPEVRILQSQQLEWKGQTYPLAKLARELSGAGIERVKVTAAPEATVNDFTLTLSTLGSHNVEPEWKRSERP